MRVLAINDISCVGKCSLCVSLPIISACGVTCDVLPTALLSTHTGGFEGYFFHDLTKDIPNVLAHWKTLGIKFDYIYSGYLGSGEQIDLVAQIKKEFELNSGVFDKDGNKIADPMQRNTESNGRFHTDWLNMIYPRLKISKDLLSDDGVIFISLDD